MVLLTSILVGAVAGGLASVVCRSAGIYLTTSMAVGILGSLLGAASSLWLGAGVGSGLTIGGTIASGVGAAVTLFLWVVAQRLFFDNRAQNVVND